MTIATKLVSTLVAATIAGGALFGAAQKSSAGSLSPAEAAAIAGLGGFILGHTLSHSPRPTYIRPVADSWGGHVERCYARYRTYDHRTDTYVGFDGDYHYCRL